MAVDWGKIEHEYITTQTSQRRLAAMHGINRTRIIEKSIAGGWVEKRNKYAADLVAKAVQKTEEETTRALVDSNECLRQACVNLSQVILRKTETLMRNQDPDTKEIESLSRTLNAQLDSNARMFGSPDDGAIKLVLSDELKELAR